MRKKVTVVGAGNVGATTAHLLFLRGYMDVVLVDIVEDMPQGKALDILESGPVVGSDAAIIGSNGYEESANSDIVVITAGIARKPGMSRDDLLQTNMKIVGEVVQQVVHYSPNSVLLVVSNPLDAMVYHASKVSCFPHNRVVGMAGILDLSRFSTFLAQEVNVSVQDVRAYVLGGHGDTMVPLVNYTTVAGVPISQMLSQDAIDRLVQRTQHGGGEIVKLLKTGSAYYAPAAAIVQMVDAILLDQKRVLPCAAYLDGQYGISGLFVGVPVKLGEGGVEEIMELDLTDHENGLLQKSAAAVQEVVDAMTRITA